MDMTELKDRILLAALPGVPLDGWSAHSLREGAVAAGLEPSAAERAFPGGALDAVIHFIDLADRLMAADMAAADTSVLRLHERVRLAIHLRLERWSLHREAVRRAAALLALPPNAAASVRSLYRTVDALWHTAGDRSMDINFYTKRAELAGIYASTLLVWLDDASEDSVQTWAFLDRRLNEAVRLRKARDRVRRSLQRLSTPLSRLAHKPAGLRRSVQIH
ncbi:COQ9 family protein [Pararhodospirillum photometricum]|uniref:COQ9 C-terminal domain-containing protein n=1 Tax=Pararhodospirillum photometricum DSM 122 TaxID=1150469 RepID=H6SKJ4_PARPM|nr:COQ9 family protein [Pararhodospirillum photometricum]CCG08509.1 Putative uncharacterized protein [Pararhodospirillum photometricum DSM 122]